MRIMRKTAEPVRPAAGRYFLPIQFDFALSGLPIKYTSFTTDISVGSALSTRRQYCAVRVNDRQNKCVVVSPKKRIICSNTEHQCR